MLWHRITSNSAVANRSRVSSAHKATTVNFHGEFFLRRKHRAPVVAAAAASRSVTGKGSFFFCGEFFLRGRNGTPMLASAPRPFRPLALRRRGSFCGAMLCISAACAVMRCLSVCMSVCLSVTFVHCVKTNKHIIKLFHCRCSHAILFFPCQMA